MGAVKGTGKGESLEEKKDIEQQVHTLHVQMLVTGPFDQLHYRPLDSLFDALPMVAVMP